MPSSAGVGGVVGSLPRPYTLGTFQKKLNEFEELIREITLQDVEATPEERRQMITENLRFDEFCDSIRALFGGDVRSPDLKAMYRKISTNPDAKVDWSELFGYFNSEGDDGDQIVGEEVNVITVSARRRVGDAAGDRKRRDVIVSLKYVSSMDAYLTASQKGVVSVWSSKFRLAACADMHETSWVTGCDYLPGIRRVAVSTERSIAIWDSRAKGKNQQVFSVTPIDNSPQCLTWVPHNSSSLEDTILFGDDQGYVNLLTVSGKDLTIKNSKQDQKKSSPVICIDPNRLATPIRKRKLHDDWVLKVKWFPELRCFGSCSPSSTMSFVLEELDRITDDGEIRGVGVAKGVNAFSYCARANIIATGGVDKVVRVWHPHIFSRPTGKLIGHLFTIVDIVCNEKDQHIISLSTARVIRIWDIHTLTSLQVFTDNEERPGEKRIYCMLFNNRHEHLLTGSSVLDAWPLTRAVQDTMQVPHTHDRPVVQVLYNKELHQVATVCSESVLRVWEVETAKHVFHVTDPHGANVEITAMALDGSGYRLATGGMNGSVKVWDFGSGQEIKQKIGRATEEDLSVISLQYCLVEEQRCIVAIGWQNRLRLLLDNESTELSVLREFNDIYYMTREVSLTPVVTNGTPFVTKTPLPDIGSTKSSASITNIFKKEPSSVITISSLLSRDPSLPTLRPAKFSAQPTRAQTPATPSDQLHDSSVYKKDYLLSSEEVTCSAVMSQSTLVTGCQSGALIYWNTESASVDKVIRLPTDPDRGRAGAAPRRVATRRSDLAYRRTNTVDNQRAVLAISFVSHRVRKLDPAFIKMLTRARHKAEEHEAEEHQGRRRSRKPSRAQSLIGQGTVRPDSTADKMADILAEKMRDESTPDGETPRPDGATSARSRDGENAQQPTEPQTDESGNRTRATSSETRAHSTSLQKENTVHSTATGETEGGRRTAGDRAETIKGDGEEDESEEDEEEVNLEEIDPETKMIIETFDPVMITCHQDSFIRFWSLEGEMYREISAVTRRQGSAVTAMCYDEDVSIIVTGDHKGYLTLWDVGKFLEDPKSEDPEAIKQLLCWRAHLTRVVQLVYVDSMRAVLSGSADGSVRVWWGRRGRYVGFLGQQRPLQLPATDEAGAPTVLPYDISEGPLAPVKSLSARQKIRAQQQQFEYPLIFDNQRWKPFRRSASLPERRKQFQEPTDKKFFEALIKPKPTNRDIESFTTGEMRAGAVFRALPVYRIITPCKPKTPDLSGLTSFAHGLTNLHPPGQNKTHRTTRATKDLDKTPRGRKLPPQTRLLPGVTAGTHSRMASAATGIHVGASASPRSPRRR